MNKQFNQLLFLRGKQAGMGNISVDISLIKSRNFYYLAGYKTAQIEMEIAINTGKMKAH